MTDQRVSDLLLSIENNIFVGKVAKSMLKIADKYGDPLLPADDYVEIGEDHGIPAVIAEQLEDLSDIFNNVDNIFETPDSLKEGLLILLKVMALKPSVSGGWLVRISREENIQDYTNFVAEAFHLVDQYIIDIAYNKLS